MTPESKKKEEIQLFPVKPLSKIGGSVDDEAEEDEHEHLDAVEPLSPVPVLSSFRASNANAKANGISRISVNLAKQYYEKKSVGLGEGAVELSSFHGPIEEHELKVRQQQKSFCLTRFVTTLMASIMVFVVYLITLETLLSSALCVGLTIYWYETVSSIMKDCSYSIMYTSSYSSFILMLATVPCCNDRVRGTLHGKEATWIGSFWAS